jgi:hypothetical protein
LFNVSFTAGEMAFGTALAQQSNFAFETTLGARTIPEMLLQGARQGALVHLWWVGLFSPDLHLQRVKARVASGGHDIPEAKIRERYETSRANLIRLLPHPASLRVYDNSAEGDPKAGQRPRPLLSLHMEGVASSPTLRSISFGRSGLHRRRHSAADEPLGGRTPGARLACRAGRRFARITAARASFFFQSDDWLVASARKNILSELTARVARSKSREDLIGLHDMAKDIDWMIVDPRMPAA